nr:lipopolysaccharide 1,2-glucosyltransferase - Helicobacter pylori (strain 26695) [Helicobacter pylori]
MQEIIPIVVAFDNNYCIPAGVSLFSMLANAKRERERERENSFIKSIVWWRVPQRIPNKKRSLLLELFLASFWILPIKNNHATIIISLILRVKLKNCINSMLFRKNAFLKSCAVSFLPPFSPNTIRSCLMWTLCLMILARAFLSPLKRIILGLGKKISLIGIRLRIYTNCAKCMQNLSASPTLSLIKKLKSFLTTTLTPGFPINHGVKKILKTNLPFSFKMKNFYLTIKMLCVLCAVGGFNCLIHTMPTLVSLIRSHSLASKKRACCIFGAINPGNSASLARKNGMKRSKRLLKTPISTLLFITSLNPFKTRIMRSKEEMKGSLKHFKQGIKSCLFQTSDILLNLFCPSFLLNSLNFCFLKPNKKSDLKGF